MLSQASDAITSMSPHRHLSMHVEASLDEVGDRTAA